MSFCRQKKKLGEKGRRHVLSYSNRVFIVNIFQTIFLLPSDVEGVETPMLLIVRKAFNYRQNLKGSSADDCINASFIQTQVTERGLNSGGISIHLLRQRTNCFSTNSFDPFYQPFRPGCPSGSAFDRIVRLNKK